MLEPYLEAGFNEYKPTCLDRCQAVAAKWVWIDGRKAFNVSVQYFRVEDHEGLTADVQFNTMTDLPVFDVTLLHPESPEQVIQFFTDIWVRMECGYYD